jgi:hypothetical protein
MLKKTQEEKGTQKEWQAEIDCVCVCVWERERGIYACVHTHCKKSIHPTNGWQLATLPASQPFSQLVATIQAARQWSSQPEANSEAASQLMTASEPLTASHRLTPRQLASKRLTANQPVACKPASQPADHTTSLPGSSWEPPSQPVPDSTTQPARKLLDGYHLLAD